jgi:hypothetical protein
LRSAFAGLSVRPALRPLKLAFARRIGAVARSRWGTSAVAITLCIWAVEPTFARPTIPGVGSRRSALAGFGARPALGPFKLAFALRSTIAARVANTALRPVSVAGSCARRLEVRARATVRAVRPWRSALAGWRTRPALRPVKLAFAHRIPGVARSRRAISAIAVPLHGGTIEAALARPTFTSPGIGPLRPTPGLPLVRMRRPLASCGGAPSLGPEGVAPTGVAARLERTSAAFASVRTCAAFLPRFGPGVRGVFDSP